MRLASLVALLPCALSAALATGACGFNPTGPGNADDDGATDDAGPDIDACVPSGPETCEGTDQDCDGMIDEGLTAGAPCDGPDADNCTDDMTVCNSMGAVVCGNTSGDDDAELCNAADDDCDGMTDEGFMVTAQCDGTDGDLCREGTLACAPDGLSAVCSDNTSTTTEICNNADDDCNNMVDDGFDLQGDEANCGECGNTCTNDFGTNTCTTGNCVPTCTNGAAE
jgi:Notch-like protein